MNPLALPRCFVVATLGVMVSEIGFAPLAHGQSVYTNPYYFGTLAGTGTAGLVDGPGTSAQFAAPHDVAVDSARNVYVADTNNARVRKITPAGVVSTITTPVFARGIAVDSAGNIFLGGYSTHTIHKITPAGVLSVVAGTLNTSGTQDGAGGAARFNLPIGIAIDTAGNLYVADSGNHAIRKITPAGVVSTFAGLAGTSGSADGAGTVARFKAPWYVCIDGGGNLFVTDRGNFTVRKITPAGVVSTVAGAAGVRSNTDATGPNARFGLLAGIAVDGGGNLFLSSEYDIKRITPAAVVSTVAGLWGTFGSTDGLGSAARFIGPMGVTVDNRGNVYIAEGSSSKIRRSYFPPAVSINLPSAATPGTTVTVAATVNSDAPVTLQWQKNSVPIPGATGDTLTLDSVQASDAAEYKVVATNVAGTGSAFAVLLIETPPVINTQPTSQTVAAGATVQFSVTVSPAFGPSFTWRKNGVAIPGGFGPSLSLSNVSAADAGTYSVVVVNAGTSVTSSNATLTVNVPPVITTQPVNQVVTAGASVQFTVAATPTTGTTFQWRKNGAAIANATSATLTLNSVTSASAGSYSVAVTNSGLSVVSNNATLTVNLPVDTQQPVTHTVSVGSLVQFNFTSNPTPGTTFQWRKEGLPIAGATNATYIINSATLVDAGNYTVVFTLGGIPQTSNTLTLIVVPLSAPVIVAQPASQNVTTGATAQFNVSASSPVAVSYQWRKNGTAIANATSDILTINNTQAADAASYSVVVTNAGGSTASSNATLTVNAPAGTAPTISTHPADQTANAGAIVSLSVSAAGSQPLTFQWFRNGNPVANATGALLTIPNAQSSDEGSYSVVVSNSAGTAASNAASVRILVPPTIATQPSSKSATAGDPVDLSVSGNGSAPLMIQWRKNGTVLPGATNALLEFETVQLADAGSYTVTLTNPAGTITSAAAILSVIPPGPSSRLTNVSIRTNLAANQIVIVGIGLTEGSRDIMVRAVGPGLTPFGVTGAMTDPRLELFRADTRLSGNEDWPAELAPRFVSAGAFGLTVGSRDAAFAGVLNGTVSIQARGTASGVVLVEAYDLGEGNSPRLINVSARNRVGTGDDILIAGFNITGTGTKQVLIRAVGPGLTALGVSGTLVDPRLDVFNSANARIAENDTWAAALATTFTAVGAFPLPNGSRDAALLTTLPVGSYTVQVRGADGGTGEAIVEIYEVP